MRAIAYLILAYPDRMPPVSKTAAIQVQDLRKYFRVPGAAPRGTLNRVMHPVQRGSRRTLRVLDGISFEVQHGERFGVVGRNGSGKSTLLRVLGSIYRADSGRVQISGRVAPFLELGIGFQPQLSARQNVALNGVMLGLSRRQVKRQVDEVIAYAELEEFQDVQLKNFSSGMRVRLAFASMLRADPDIYLLDEIFAVGDDAFREKCGGELEHLRGRGKTIIVVSHRPGNIERQSDRAILLEDGRIAAAGDTEAVLARYRAANAAAGGAGQDPGSEPLSGNESTEPRAARPDRVPTLTLAVKGSQPADHPSVATGEALRVSVEAQASGWVKGPTLELSIRGEDGTNIFIARDRDPDRLPVLKPGEKAVAEITVENPLAPGRYRLGCSLLHDTGERLVRVSPVRSIDFEVVGKPREGLLALDRTVTLGLSSSLELVR